ncbi:uncharacterized protein LOC112461202, partial [Temnothorax curvispinosus]|uniref:Uncharacterized protein LOC112461202 n=1 Tax=Temnothorax curvispinosus TaxID=300111 RepID=A0A6J1QIC2_9HYME
EHKSAMKSSKLSEKKFTTIRSKLLEKNVTEKSISVPTAKTSESELEPESGLSNNQLPSIMLLDTQLPVISENDLIKYTNNKDPLSVDINAIWSKLIMLESDSKNLNKM